MIDPQGSPEHADADAGWAAPNPRADATAAVQRRPLPAHEEQQERPSQDEARLQAANGLTATGTFKITFKKYLYSGIGIPLNANQIS